MAWLTLLPLAALCALGAWLSYVPEAKASWWYVWAFTLMSAACGLMYGWAMQRTSSDHDSFALCLVWDGIVTVVYAVVPVLFMGVKVPPAGWVGVGLVAIGAVVLKVSVPH